MCKIIDYGKFKYQQRKKSHQGRVKQHVTHVKALRIRPKTDRHDLGVKIRKAREFLERHDRVVFNVLFRGREMAHTELGRGLLGIVAEQLEDIAKIERPPTMAARTMSMTLAPRTQEAHRGHGQSKG